MGSERTGGPSPAPGERLGVLVVGGGVGALEAVLALRALAEERVAITLLCPVAEFRYRPASVVVPFGRGEVYRYAVSGVTEEAGASLHVGSLVGVDVGRHRAVTATGDELAYDVLVVACGARRLPVLRGALAFGGEQDVPAIQELLADIDAGRAKRLVFALPREASWALPLYELALLTATHVAARPAVGISISLVTPEDQPLAQFGGEASEAVARLLRRNHIDLHTGTYPVEVLEGRLVLVPPGSLEADRVVTVPAARGTPISGLPPTPDGFLPTDGLGRVTGTPDVYAVGDITTFPIKQGGIAAQQADLVAQSIAMRAGADLDEPRPLRPVLRGLLVTGGDPHYLIADPTGGKGDTASSSTEPLWWPGGKIAAHYLGPYLAHAPHTTDREPTSD